MFNVCEKIRCIKEQGRWLYTLLYKLFPNIVFYFPHHIICDVIYVVCEVVGIQFVRK